MLSIFFKLIYKHKNMDYVERRQNAIKSFTAFVEASGFASWHIHNGWVMNGRNDGDILHHEDIRIVWIYGHEQHSHPSRCPRAGEKMIIVSDIPDMEELKPFLLYCYDVVDRDYAHDEIKLKRVEVKKAVFNKEENKYQMYIEEPYSFFSFLKEVFKDLKKELKCI